MPVDPVTNFDGRFSEPGADPIPWADARRVLEEAEIFWLSTVRRDGRPHVTPLLALWQDGALHFSTGPEEQKARNLRHNRRCVLTTGCNAYRHGLDVVVEGQAARVTDTSRLQRLADSWTAKFGPEWQFEVRGDTLVHARGTALMFELSAVTAFAFARGPYVQTAYRFTGDRGPHSGG